MGSDWLMDSFGWNRERLKVELGDRPSRKQLEETKKNKRHLGVGECSRRENGSFVMPTQWQML